MDSLALLPPFNPVPQMPVDGSPVQMVAPATPSNPPASHGGTGFPFVGNSDFEPVAKRVKYADEEGGEKETPQKPEHGASTADPVYVPL